MPQTLLTSTNDCGLLRLMHVLGPNAARMVAAWQLCSCEGLFVSLHGVEDGEKLSGDGDDCDFLRSGSVCDGIEEAFETGVCANGTEGGHVESVAHAASSALDVLASPAMPAVIVERCEAGQGADLLWRQGAEFGQMGHEGQRRYFADARRRGQPFEFCGEFDVAPCVPVDLGFDGSDPVAKTFDDDVDIGDDAGVKGIGTMALFQGSQLDELIAPPGQRRQSLAISGRGGVGFWLNHLAEIRQTDRIDPVGLGEASTHLGKAARLHRIKPTRGNAMFAERMTQEPVMNAGCLEDDETIRAGKRGRERLDGVFVIGNALAALAARVENIEEGLGNVAAKDGLVYGHGA